MAKLLTAATPISYYLVVVNIVAFILYGTDKAKAMHHQWRIKEAVLIGIAFVGGAFGAFAGMIVFHHKTRKMKFRILVPIAIIIWLTFGGFLAGRDVVGLTKTDRPKNEYNSTEITPYHSSVDKDGDGTDDQTDILTNALVYVKKRPVYKSRYYQTGYPDDRYGVCTDVVGYALKKSGYDLRELVDEDIRKNPKDYDIDEPDKNIDFRRVKNLKIYFEHTAISLTTDVNDIEQWQGGDIVVFKNHIGVISDRRNVEGVPYVIHHNDPYQKNYEEDILQERTDIVGHFRIS